MTQFPRMPDKKKRPPMRQVQKQQRVLPPKRKKQPPTVLKATWHKAQLGETLCSIAAKYGLKDCDRLRALTENAPYRNGVVPPGKWVRIPARQPKRVPRNTGARHTWQTGLPGAWIHFIREQELYPNLQGEGLHYLNVSNYVTNLAGENGRERVPRDFGYNDHGHADPDTFKIEVIDPGAKGETVQVTLQALKPLYGKGGKVTGYDEFKHPDPDCDKRKVTIECKRHHKVRYRSRYLRLVVDEKDFEALANPTQALLTTDVADGKGGENDMVEILDQWVQATYVLSRCPAGGQHKCRVYAELPIGHNKRRLRVSFHVFRETIKPGFMQGEVTGNLTTDDVRRHALKWMRRTYAQINLAPKLVPIRPQDGPHGAWVEFVDQPPNDMISINEKTGDPVKRVRKMGRKRIKFRLGAKPRNPTPQQWQRHDESVVKKGPKAKPPPPNVEVTVKSGWTPKRVCEAIQAKVKAVKDARGFDAKIFSNPPRLGRASGSCDLLITCKDSKWVPHVTQETCVNAGVDIEVARVKVSHVKTKLKEMEINVYGPIVRRLVRSCHNEDDRIDFYVCARFDDFEGLAMSPQAARPTKYRPRVPFVRGAFLCRYCFKEGEGIFQPGEGLMYTPSHEAGHILYDGGHVDKNDANCAQALMAAGTKKVEKFSVDAPKRIYDTPVLVKCSVLNDKAKVIVRGDVPWADLTINMAKRFCDLSRKVTEGW